MLFKVNFDCVVKGYHECSFNVNVGEAFIIRKINGPYGLAFRAQDHRGILGHLQKETVPILSDIEGNMKCYVIGKPTEDPRGRWKSGGGLHVPVTMEVVLIDEPLVIIETLKNKGFRKVTVERL